MLVSFTLRQASQRRVISPSFNVLTRRTYVTLPNVDPASGECPAVIPGTAGTYAMQFFEDAFAQGGDIGVRRFEKELNVLTWSVRKDADLWTIETSSPLIDVDERTKMVADRLKKLGCSDFFTKCILNLMQSNIIGRLSQLRVDYEEIMRAYRREVDVTLITKSSLPKPELEFFKKNIQLNFLRPNDNMIFTHFTDVSITKGYKVIVAGTTHDYTWNKDQVDYQEEKQTAIKAEEQVLTSQLPKIPAVYLKETLQALISTGDAPKDAFAQFIEQ